FAVRLPAYNRPDFFWNDFEFISDPAKGQLLHATYEAGDKVFSITGTAAVTAATNTKDPASYPAIVSLGSRGTSGLVLDGKPGGQSQFSFAIDSITWADNTFRGTDLTVRFDAATRSFQYSGKANWLVNDILVPVTPLIGSTGALAGFVTQG